MSDVALAEIGNNAELAAERLEQPGSDVRAVFAMLRIIQGAARSKFLAGRGAETDYEVIGDNVRKRFKTAKGTWRPTAPAGPALIAPAPITSISC